MTKTVGARINDKLHKNLLERCNKEGCTVSDFLKGNIEVALNGSYSSIEKEFENCTECDEEVHDTLRMINKHLHNAQYFVDSSEKTGKPIKAELCWPENDDEGFFDEKPSGPGGNTTPKENTTKIIFDSELKPKVTVIG